MESSSSFGTFSRGSIPKGWRAFLLRNKRELRSLHQPRTQNKAEQDLIAIMEDDGYQVFKRGWPDFFCEKEGSLVLVEVRPNAKSRLKYEQHVVMTGLAQFGIPCYFWSPEAGFLPADEADFVLSTNVKTESRMSQRRVSDHDDLMLGPMRST